MEIFCQFNLVLRGPLKVSSGWKNISWKDHFLQNCHHCQLQSSLLVFAVISKPILNINKGRTISNAFFLSFNSSKIKLIYSEKATKFCESSTLLLSYVVPDKSKVEISQKFCAFSEYMNFKGRTISNAFFSILQFFQKTTKKIP